MLNAGISIAIKRIVSHTIHVWYICLHLVDFYGKCREIYHTWMVWVCISVFPCGYRVGESFLQNMELSRIRYSSRKSSASVLLGLDTYHIWTPHIHWNTFKEPLKRNQQTIVFGVVGNGILSQFCLWQQQVEQMLAKIYLLQQVVVHKSRSKRHNHGHKFHVGRTPT